MTEAAEKGPPVQRFFDPKLRTPSGSDALWLWIDGTYRFSHWNKKRGIYAAG